MPNIICKVCSKSFYIYPYQIGKKQYCSKKCISLFLKGKPIGPMKETQKRQISKTLKGKYAGPTRWNYIGKCINSHGYVILINPERFNNPKKRYILEHRIIMEQHIGRPLNEKEIVHHINDIKTDNRIENLKLFSNINEHISFHRKNTKPRTL